MPNILTHMVVGAEIAGTDSPEFLLGCALPDFVGMYRDKNGVRVQTKDVFSQTESPEIGEGVALHYRTDSTYDFQPLRIELKRQLTEDLEAFVPSLGRAAVQGCADAGNDILLDGVLFSTQNPKSVYELINKHINAPDSRLRNALLSGLGDNIGDYFGRHAPQYYQDPRRVAELLHDRFEQRPGQRLAFGEEDVDAVAYCFGQQIERLRAVGGQLVDLTVEGLSQQAA